MPFDSAVSTIEIVAKKRGRPSGTAKASRKTPIGTKQTAIYKRMSEKFAARGWTRTFIQEQLLLDQNVASDAMSELVKQSIMSGFAEFVVATRGMIETFSDIFSQQNVVVSTVANGRTATVLELFSLYSLKEIEDNGISAEKMIQQLQVPSHTRQYATKFARIYDDIMFIWDLLNELPTNQHANVAEKIIGYLKKNDSKFERKNGFVSTPFWLTRDIVAKISLNNGDSILDPACGRGTFLMVALQKNPNIKVYGIDKDAGKAFIAAALLRPQNLIVDTIYIGDTLSLSGSDLEGIFGMPKFDAVVGNPPYQDDLHLKFLELAYTVSERHVAFVHPSGWLTAQKPGNGSSLKSKADALKDRVGKGFTQFDLIHGNIVFGIRMFQPCVISYIDKQNEKENVTVTRLDKSKVFFATSKDINPFMVDSEIFDSIKTKIWRLCEHENISGLLRQPKGDYYVSLPTISGDVGRDGNFIADNFYQLVAPNDRTVTTEPKKGLTTEKQWVSFLSEPEAENFLNYLTKTMFAKFALMIVKTNANMHRGELKFVPFLDFSQEWTDKKLYQLAEFTDEEILVVESLATSNGKIVVYETEKAA